MSRCRHSAVSKKTDAVVYMRKLMALFLFRQWRRMNWQEAQIGQKQN
jgi:hypothetical protein